MTEDMVHDSEKERIKIEYYTMYHYYTRYHYYCDQSEIFRKVKPKISTLDLFVIVKGSLVDGAWEVLPAPEI